MTRLRGQRTSHVCLNYTLEVYSARRIPFSTRAPISLKTLIHAFYIFNLATRSYPAFLTQYGHNDPVKQT